MTMGHRRLGKAVVALFVIAAVGTGCSADSGQGGEDSKLSRTLSSLAAESVGEKSVTYLDMARVRELAEDGGKRFSAVELPASALITGYEAGPWGGQLKRDQIDTAVDSEVAGHWEGRFDAAAITGALKSNGYERKEEFWRDAEGSKPSLKVSDDEISYSHEGTDPMAAVHPDEGASLADEAEYRRAAECLGDVYRADFAGLRPDEPTRLSVLGQQASSASENTEILCAVVKDKATAERVAAELRSVVREEAPRFDGTKVTVENGEQPYVRAVVPDKASQRPGRLATTDTQLWMAANGA
ncbi:hypothetical protein [Streptomyces sp. JB150]|uniref:hypothetical protein n=1 Tax=Streptomyces sp. JB150 TaxID=2714844 RepID=UPI001F0F14C9|nr:hypothetical protein [Streptomyces sp. JB150]